MQRIAIIGYGYVGKAVAKLFKGRFDVIVSDPAVQIPAPEMINSADLAIVCVPTPQGGDNYPNTAIVEEVVELLSVPMILITSTVPPGTCKRLSETTGKRIVFSPEFIGESDYVIPWWKGLPHPTDIKYQDFQIFGGAKEDVHYVMQFFKPVLGPMVKYAQTDHTTAELVKYMHNSWGAMKVTFANEFFQIAQAFGVEYDELRELALLNKFMEPMHTMVFEDKRGFNGKCLPKDLAGIIAASSAMGYDAHLLQQVQNSNEEFLQLNKAQS